LAGQDYWCLQNLSDADLEARLLKAAHPDRAAEIGQHVHEHLARYRLLFDSVGSAQGRSALLDVGGTGNLLPLYIDDLAYPFVAMANKWRSISLDSEYLSQFISPSRFRCDYFDAEADLFPYADASFDTVVCSEVIEHLKHDPANMLAEINRVLKREGKLILTTPNITSSMALYRILSGMHPQSWSIYTGKDGDRHNREYTPREIGRLMDACGFGDIQIDTFSLGPNPFKVKLTSVWVSLPGLFQGQMKSWRQRGEYILAIGRKTGSVRDRFPGFLYG